VKSLKKYKKLLLEVEDLLLDINYCSDEKPELISE